MKGSIMKDKKTGKYFYVTDMGINPLTWKRTQKRRAVSIPRSTEHALGECLKDVRHR
jgi:hypothetical protein